MAAKGPTFHVSDIPVTIEPSFFLVIGVFALAAPGLDALLLWVVIATASVLVHELGHAVAFRVYGSSATIRLHGMGGLTTGARLPPARNLVVSLAGPLSGLVLLGLPAVLIASSEVGDGDRIWELALEYAILINVFWSLVNLLPVLPLDGGNVVQALLHLATGRDAERTTRYVSIAVAAVGGVVALALGLVFAVVLAALALGINIAGLSQERADGWSMAVAEAQRALATVDHWGAVQQAEPIVMSSAGPVDRARAVDVQVWSWLLAGDLPNTQLALARRPPGVPVPASLQGALALVLGHNDRAFALLAYGLTHEPPGPEHLFATHVVARAGQVAPVADELLAMQDTRALDAAEAMATILHHGGRFDEAAALASRLHTAGRRNREVWAYNAACSLARGGWIDDSLGWLRVAVDEGWSDGERLATDPDLALLRPHPTFAALQRQLATVR
jgi:Zn-dependent protease